MGAPFGRSFEALLEKRLNEPRLNEPHSGKVVTPVEILNFAVSGYRLTQMVDVAVTKAAAFHPDVSLIVLTENSGSRRWAAHLMQLVYDGIDLKYDFLKRITEDAGVTSKDPPETAEAKLARFRVPTIRWCLAEITKQTPVTIVLLVPMVREQDEVDEQFEDFKTILADLRIPVVDLLDTFAAVPNRQVYRVSSTNHHPNERGHSLLFDKLYAKLLADPVLDSALTGGPTQTDLRATK
jgi:hypothetical protein